MALLTELIACGLSAAIRDFAPTELGRQSFVGRRIITHALVFGGGTVSFRLRLHVWRSRHAIKGAAADTWFGRRERCEELQ
jgi:hypothetical protein